MHLAPIGNTVRIAASIIFKFIFADFFSVHRASLVTQDDNARCKREKNPSTMLPRFAYFLETSPFDFALLGGTGNRLKSKTTAK
jgi:hypothetical protein